jgi:hypothetical protein
MKFKFLKVTIVGLMLSVSGFASAVMITHNGYTLNTDTNIVTTGSTEWLKWTETAYERDIYQSYLDYKMAGWEFATNAQMARLLNDFNFGVTFDDDPNTGQRATLNDAGIVDENSPIRMFFELFGVQVYNSTQLDVEIPVSSITAVFGDNYTNRGQYLNSVRLTEGHYYKFYTDELDLTTDGYTSSSAYMGAADGYDLFGTHSTIFALVRPVSQVPEPSTLAIFALGIMGLALRRFKKQS